MAMADYRGVRLGSEGKASAENPGSSFKMVITTFIDIGGIEYLDETEVTIQKGK